MYWKKLIKLKLQYFNISAFILFSSLAIRTFVDYFSSLKDTFENKWPVEYNSFYYLVELREYASTGSGYYSPFLPFFFVLSKIQHFFGLSDIETYNSVVIASFLIFAGALAAMSYDKKRPFVAPAMIFILLSSRMIFFAHYSYLKQAAGVAFFASYLGFVHLAKTVDRRSIKNILFGFAFFSIVIASAFHKFSGFLAIMFLLIPFENKIPPRVKMAAVAIVAILFTILLYQRHPDGSDMFAIQWPPLWYSYVKNKQISGFENMEFIIYILFALSMAGVLIWKKAKIDLVILALAIYFLLSLLFFAPGAWRFILSAGWIVMIASSLFQGADCEKISLKLKNGILFTVVALILLNLGLSSKQPRIIGPAMPVSALESNREILDQWLPKDAFVVAPLGVQFRVKYFLNRESARSSLPRQLDKTYSIKDLYEQGPPCAKMDAGKIDDLSKVHCFKLGKFWKITRGL